MEKEFTFFAVMVFAVVTAFGHTLAGPDHYLPFIALAKCRNWNMAKTMMWTFVCGIGHILSALALALAFYYLSHWLSEEYRDYVETYRGLIAAWLLVIFGVVYTLWGGFTAWRERPHKHVHRHESGEEHVHTHRHSCIGHRHWHERPNTTRILPWILFIIFAFGPCEALWPLLLMATTVSATCTTSWPAASTTASVAPPRACRAAVATNAPAAPVGFVFRGWDVVENGKVWATDLQPGAPETFKDVALNPNLGRITLRAMWDPKSPYFIKYNPNTRTSNSGDERGILQYGGPEYRIKFTNEKSPYLLIKLTQRDTERLNARTASGRKIL